MQPEGYVPRLSSRKSKSYSMSEETFILPDDESLLALFGTCDRYVRRIAQTFGVKIWSRQDKVHIQGDSENVRKAQMIVARMIANPHLTDDDLACYINAMENYKTIPSPVTPSPVSPVISSPTISQSDFSSSEFSQSESKGAIGSSTTAELPDVSPIPQDVKPLEVFTGRRIRPRTAGQARFLKALQKNEITFCSGPAGTGKTYLAVAAAVAAMKSGHAERIMLVRPAVEAGESLGYLPGDLRAKINPYLRPLFDSLHDMMDPMSITRLTEEDIIEVIPLAYMRGRTFNNAYIILDEAQNTTISQMKMFLTRMGENSRVVVSGDTSQIDLPPRMESGLVDAIRRLKGIKGIGMIELNASDIVRHHLVQKIVTAYEGVQ